MADEPLQRRIRRRFVPFAAVGLLAPLTAFLPPRPESWTLVWIAMALTAGIAVVGLVAPWSLLPRWTFLIPPLAYFGVVALMREATDSSTSGYTPLMLLPVIWIALNLGRAQVAIGVAAGITVLAVPLLGGNPETYTAGDWRRAILWAATAGIAGFSIESLMREKRTHAREAREHERTIAAIASVARVLAAGTDARTHICEATLEITGARFAAIWEPVEPDGLVMTGRAGPDVGLSRFTLDTERSGTVRAFKSGERYLAPDALSDPNLPQDAVRAGGIVSMLFEPIVREDATVGVLTVGWGDSVTALGPRLVQAAELLAVEASVAIERADFLARLSDLAETDDLTGLPNRRAWNETMRRAVGYADRTRRTLCVALLDLDRFKEFNDRHGHQTGDRLLKTAAASWRAALRESDTLARYGGEEFAVALPSCTTTEAYDVLERLRECTPEGQTCSIGIAEWVVHETADELVARADAALYEAKRKGRNTIVAAS